MFSSSTEILDESKFIIDLSLLSSTNSVPTDNMRCFLYKKSAISHDFALFDYSSLSNITLEHKKKYSTLLKPYEFQVSLMNLSVQVRKCLKQLQPVQRFMFKIKLVQLCLRDIQQINQQKCLQVLLLQWQLSQWQKCLIALDKMQLILLQLQRKRWMTVLRLFNLKLGLICM